MLDDTRVDNGAMFVIPGTHRDEIFNHHGSDGYFFGAIDPETAALDFNQAVACEGPAGSVTFHYARTVHGSAQNTSDRARGLLLYELMAADAYPLLSKEGWPTFTHRLIYGAETNHARLRDCATCPCACRYRQPNIKGRFMKTK